MVTIHDIRKGKTLLKLFFFVFLFFIDKTDLSIKNKLICACAYGEVLPLTNHIKRMRGISVFT